MELAELTRRAAEFAAELQRVKESVPSPFGTWYPPMLPHHVERIDRLLVGEHRALFEAPAPRPIADIGGADGDLGFFLGSVGFDVDIYDALGRPALLKDALGSDVGTPSVDLDTTFELPRTYEIVTLLHVLYHLRNPMQAMDRLARYARYCIFSTRTANRLPGPRRRWRRDVGEQPIAYLLDPGELNPRDPHNYWIFTEAGLLRLLARTGWEVLNHFAIGDVDAGPADRDQPVTWCLLRSTEFTGA